MPNPPKLMVRLRTTSRSFDSTEKGLIPLEEKDPIKIIEGNLLQGNPWDDAHEAVKNNPDFSYAEPDLDSSEVFYLQQQEIEERGEATEDTYYQFLDAWSHPDNACIWHLDDSHSQLKSAREAVAQAGYKKLVRIAHIDTGYDKDHMSFPASLIRKDLERNFVEGEESNWNNAADTFTDGTLKMPGHGTGTLSILAGTKMDIPSCGFSDYIGLFDSIEIVPIRIAKSVVLLKSGAFVRALDYIVNELSKDESKRVHIVTMSMGGVASKAWADLVNLAYEKGIFIVTAAGNNFKKLPTRTMIYPARFNRVVAACGVTYNLSPYSKPRGEGSFHIMEGNYGPSSLMNTAIAAFTPNVPWATYKFDKVVGIRGDGTSSATPQVAAAAALYYIKNYDALEALPEPWMRVEAIRKALFESAKKEINSEGDNFENDYKKYYGNGIVQASEMLTIKVATAAELVKQEEDSVSFAFFKLILGIRSMEEDEAAEEEMLETELMQLVLTDENLQAVLDNEEKKIETLSDTQKKQVAETVLRNKNASAKMKERMQLLLNQLNIGSTSSDF
jgi:subtilisin family serine protease